MPLTTIERETRERLMQQAMNSPKNSRGKSPSVTLGGCRALLWERAPLNEYLFSTDARRIYKTVGDRLAQISEDHLILGGDQRMCDRIFFPDVPFAPIYQKSAEVQAAKLAHQFQQIDNLEASFKSAASLCQQNEALVVLMLGELLGTDWVEARPGSTATTEWRITLKSSGSHNETRDYVSVVHTLAKKIRGRSRTHWCIKVSRADLLGDLKSKDKRGSYLDVGGQCWYVLGCDSKGRPIGHVDDVPPECGVMIAEPNRLHVARNAAKRSFREMPFAIWMALAKATPVNFGDVGSENNFGQSELTEQFL